MKKNYLTKVYGNGYSPGTNMEPKLKAIAAIILLVCIILLIVSQRST